MLLRQWEKQGGKMKKVSTLGDNASLKYTQSSTDVEWGQSE